MGDHKPVGYTRDFNRIRAKIFNMVSVGVIDEPINRFYDVLSIIALALNLFAAFAITFDYMEEYYKGLLLTIEAVTVFFFAVDYVLRLITAKELYPKLSDPKAMIKYVTSFSGVIDLLSFLPYYLPFFFPAGSAVFRLFRVARILRLFRINSYYDQLNVITEVLISKKQQLMASVFIIIILMMGSSLCMYSVEHDAQPDVFQNAFSGIWWSVSTLLTVGYGDIYPITIAGKALGIVISFLGVGMVAIPTGIISAGFVEQYQKLKTAGDFAEEE
ncbi:MAG: ion transporter, partial [Butyrivibrio sp.]|nr:ion transporter [Butyrivibrio sp.]